MRLFTKRRLRTEKKRREVGNSPPRRGKVNGCVEWCPDWGQWAFCLPRRALWTWSTVISRVFWWWGSFPRLFRGALETRGSVFRVLGEETLFSFLGRWGREGAATHVVRIVFHSMSLIQTVLISCKQSLQWWFHCMRLQTCVGSVFVGVTTLLWCTTDGMCTSGIGNSTRLLQVYVSMDGGGLRPSGPSSGRSGSVRVYIRVMRNLCT